MSDRVVLAYSGGLDTSVAVRWLIENEGVEVVAVAVDVGQSADRGGEDWDAVRDTGPGRRRRRGRGGRRPPRDGRAVLRAGPAGQRPLRGQVPAGVGPVAAGHRAPPGGQARLHGATAVAHGCTGKGNDQVRFEVGVRALAPDLGIYAPARVWGLTREDCVELAAKWDIPITVTKEKLYSIDDNLWGKAIECGAIEDPWAPAPDDVYTLTRVSESDPVEVIVGFEAGVPGQPRRHGARALRPDRPAGPDGRQPRLRPARHDREPPGRHQEPRGLRVPGRPGADHGPRRPRGPDARAGRAPREGPPRAALGRARLRRAVVLAAAQPRCRPSSPRASATSPERCGCASPRRAPVPWWAGAARSRSTTTTWRPTMRRTASGTPTPRVSSACGASGSPRGRPARGRARRRVPRCQRRRRQER